MNLVGCLSNFEDKKSTVEIPTKIHTEPCFQEISQEVQKEEKNQHHRSQLNIDKKIKIKGHHKTETGQQTQSKSINTRIKTSPKKQSVLGESDINKKFYPSTAQKITKPYRSQWELIDKDATYTQTLSYNELLPQKKRQSFLLTKNQQSMSSYFQKDEDRVSSKSKKKIQFTVYEGRKKSLSKENNIPSQERLNPRRSISKIIPYPCTQSIVIDLFNNPEKTHSKSKEKILSRQSSTEKVISFHKKLNKSKSNQIIDAKIEKTIEKLWKFQIVSEYAEVGELEGMLLGYQIAGEPECKWALMAIDQIFGKIRKAKQQ